VLGLGCELTVDLPVPDFKDCGPVEVAQRFDRECALARGAGCSPVLECHADWWIEFEVVAAI